MTRPVPTPPTGHPQPTPVPGATPETILTPEALAFVDTLTRRFGARRDELLAARAKRQATLERGELPDFLESTRAVREADWRVAPPRPDLTDRRVEITGPVDRKMIINALNSGANVFMADFEDATSPTWDNVVQGQVNLHDAVRGTIEHAGQDGRTYRLNPTTATLMVRPRGWHLDEKHHTVDGRPVPGALFDFGLFFFHNAHALVERGSGPYFYLPKLESHLEARLWNDVFEFAQGALGLPRGTIRATVLIETILAAFEMDEILYELREHSAGLNCGRWDYIFSVIKKLGHRPDFVLPDRARVTMTTPMMRAYSLLAIRTAHRRGAHAMGGMSAFIPVRGDPAANDRAFEQVRLDKEREAWDGHDGTWVAHPALVPVAREAFDRLMHGPNQLGKLPDADVTARDLLTVPDGPVTEAGVRTNIRVALQYVQAWLRGQGAVPIDHLMEDAATAEISRAQLWQWRHHGVTLDTGEVVTADLLTRLTMQELTRLGASGRHDAHLMDATGLLQRLVMGDRFTEFLTIPGYRHLA